MIGKQVLGGPDEFMIFFREDLFYSVQGVLGIPLKTQAFDNAILNPGTVRVEDAAGNVLWRPQ